MKPDNKSSRYLFDFYANTIKMNHPSFKQNKEVTGLIGERNERNKSIENFDENFNVLI